MTDELIRRHGEVIASTTRLGFYPIVVTGGEGAIVRDAEGRQWIDFLASAAALNTGVSHPVVVEAIRRQAEILPHYSAAYIYQEPMVDLAEALVERVPIDGPMRVAFGLSGGDSIDGAIKAARHRTGRQKIIGFRGSYHGTTYGALSLSSVNLDMRRGMGPFLPEIHHLPFPDPYHDPWRRSPEDVGADALATFDAMLANEVPGEEVAAVIMEPIQGDSGVLIPTRSFVQGIRERCDRYGMLFIVDEVQAGFGRTGRWFSIEHFGVVPDGVVCGKSISSGIPLSAFVARSEVLDGWEAPAHTFSSVANLIGCAAALATIRVVADEGLVERSRVNGEHLRDRLAELATRHELIGDIRGEGLMVGAELVTSRETREPARDATAKVAWRCYELGLLITFLRGNVLRMVPPLVIERGQLDDAIDILDRALGEVARGEVSDDAVAGLKGW